MEWGSKVFFCKRFVLAVFFIFLLSAIHLINAQSQRVFAVIGDYGSDDSHEAAVATMINSWQPNFIITVGDNADTGSYSDDIGKYYHQYMYPHEPTYGGSDTTTFNHFWPSVGNTDWDFKNLSSLSTYKSYFTLPNNGDYYTVQIGDIGFFMVDADTREPDSTTSTSVQGQWTHQQILNSNAKWKIVVFHHPAYCSGDNPSNPRMQWPFEDWGIDAVLNGHSHVYERILRDDNSDGDSLLYIVDGTAGEPLGYFFAPYVNGSDYRDYYDWGALKVIENNDSLRFEFHSVSSGYPILDSYTVVKSPLAVELNNFTAVPISPTTVQLKWSTATEVNNYGFEVERKSAGSEWEKIGFVAGSGNSNSPKEYSYTDNPEGGTSFSYRLKQIDVNGNYTFYPSITVSIESRDQEQLMQNYPNPFNPITVIKYQITKESIVIIKLYDMLGKEIKTLVDRYEPAGIYSYTLDASGLSSGIYYYKIQAGDFVQTKKLVLMK